MPNEATQTPAEDVKSQKPTWLSDMNPQAELIKIWNDVFESDCQCDICVRLRKALSGVKGTPPTGLGK